MQKNGQTRQPKHLKTAHGLRRLCLLCFSCFAFSLPLGQVWVPTQFREILLGRLKRCSAVSNDNTETELRHA